MRRYTIAAALIGVAGLTFSCARAADQPAPARDHVRLAALPFLSHTPFHIAKAEGYFEEQGLDVEFLMLGRNQDVMTALAHGDVDAMAGMLTLNELSLMAAGARVRVVAALAGTPPADLGCAQYAVVARREHLESGALADRERIRRMRFDISPFIPLGYALDELLRTFDLTVDDVETVDLTPPVALEALRNGQIDVTADSEPFISMHVATGEAVIWRSVNDLIPGWTPSVVLFGPTLLDERPAVGQRFMTAVLKAMRQYRQGKTPRNLTISEQASGLTAEQVAGACWPTPTEDGRVDAGSFLGYQEWSLRRGLLSRLLSADELVDQRFIEYANAELGR